MNLQNCIGLLVLSIFIATFNCCDNRQNVSCNLQKGTDYYEQSNENNYDFYYDLENAVSCSKQVGKPLLLIFRHITCNSTPGIDLEVLRDKKVNRLVTHNFIPTILYVDDPRIIDSSDSVYFLISKLENGCTIGEGNIAIQMKYFQSNAQPQYVIANPNLEQIGSRIPYMRLRDRNNFIEELEKRIR